MILIVASAAASALPYNYVTWNENSNTGTSVNGTIGSVGVTLTGPYSGVSNNFNVFAPNPSNYIGGPIGNAPNTNAFVTIANAGTYTLTFSQAVQGLAFDLWSVGQPNFPVSYTFDQSLSIVAGGANSQYGGSSITNVGNVVTGIEGNGAILFRGSFTTLTFVVDRAEFYHGFTIGLPEAPTVPGPGAALAFAGTALLRRRRRA